MTNKLLMLSKYLIFTALILSLVSCKSRSDRDKLAGYLNVTKVVDGDTFWVDDGSEKGLKIRLIGVDTPETRHPKKGVEYYGKEASDYAKSELTDKKVMLKYDVERYDRYGRTLAYVYLQDGTFFNADLVKKGFAHAMTVPPNVKYSEMFVKLEREARENNVGLWKEN